MRCLDASCIQMRTYVIYIDIDRFLAWMVRLRVEVSMDV